VVKSVASKLHGHLEFCKSHDIVRQIKLTNPKPFSPLPSVKVEKLFGLAVFERVDGDQVQLTETQMRLLGKKFFVSKIDQDSVATYSDYVRVIFD
jgi:hypothetical protein